MNDSYVATADAGRQYDEAAMRLTLRAGAVSDFRCAGGAYRPWGTFGHTGSAAPLVDAGVLQMVGKEKGPGRRPRCRGVTVSSD